MRLDVSPAAAPNPRGVFNQRFEALFPHDGALGCAVCFVPRHLSGLSVCECGAAGNYRSSACPVLRHSESGPLGLCTNVGLQGLLMVRLLAWLVPHSSSLGHHSNVSSLPPSCLSLPLLPVWMNVYFLFPWCRTSLPFDFLSVLVVRGGAVCLPTLPS